MRLPLARRAGRRRHGPDPAEGHQPLHRRGAQGAAARTPALRPGLSEIIGAIQPEAGLFVLEEGGEPLATLICVHDGDLAGLFEIATDAARARQGPWPAHRAVGAEMGAAARRARSLAAGRGRQCAGAGALRVAGLRGSLSLPLSPAAGAHERGVEPAERACCWSPPARWSMPTAACCWRSGPKASSWPACGNFPAARSSPARRRKKR